MLHKYFDFIGEARGRKYHEIPPISKKLKTKDDIKKLCDYYEIKDYLINDDLSIDVYDNDTVDLQGTHLSHIPFNFRSISSHFCCNCSNFVDLVGSPESIDGFFACTSNKLTSLKGAPKYVSSYFACSYNPNLKSLVGCPETPSLYCDKNGLTDFKGIPDSLEHIVIGDNPVTEIFDLFPKSDHDKRSGFGIKDIRYIKLINEYDVIQGMKVSLFRLEEVFEELGIEIPEINLKNYEII